MKDLKSLDLKKYDTCHEEMVAIICLQSFLHRLQYTYAKRRICEVVSKGPVTDALGEAQPGTRYTIQCKKLITLIKDAVRDTISYMKSCQRDDEYHGFIFALKNEKEYLLIKRSDKTNKTDGLITYLGITRSYLDEECDLRKYLKIPIDYDTLRDRIEERRQSSIAFLKNTIAEAKKEE